MKKAILSILSIAVVLLAGCAREEATTGAAGETATIGRPEPKPGELGTDALTQTVELEDGRSENEGGVLTEGGPDEGTTTTTAQATTTTTTTTNAVPPPRRP